MYTFGNRKKHFVKTKIYVYINSWVQEQVKSVQRKKFIVNEKADMKKII